MTKTEDQPHAPENARPALLRVRAARPAHEGRRKAFVFADRPTRRAEVDGAWSTSSLVVRTI